MLLISLQIIVPGSLRHVLSAETERHFTGFQTFLENTLA